MGVLNCFRSLAYLMASLLILLHASKQAAANLMRPTFNEFKAILKPAPLSESMFSKGTFVSLKKTCLVEDALMPNLCSSSPKRIPFGVFESYSTINAVMFLSSSIRAKTIIKLQNPAFEIHIF